jgi:hypothetical protein
MRATPGPRSVAGRGGGVLVLAFDDVLERGHQELYDRVLAASGHDQHDVSEVRVTECGIEIDVIDFDAPEWPLRTMIYGPAGGRLVAS